MIRDRPPYGQSQFITGLRAAGFKVSTDPSCNPRPGDVLLLWNRGGTGDAIARRFERAGARVIVAENGWLGRTADGGKFYSLAEGWHNGLGRWPIGTGDRWPLLNVGLKPWRQNGKHILVLPSRGIGAPGVAMPPDWTKRTVAALKARTKRHIKVRPHPGDGKAPLDADLNGAHAVVTWGSGAAVKAIAAGVPAFHDLKRWIGADASLPIGADLEQPFLGCRTPMFHRLAWASWTASEIATGDPFTWLLSTPQSMASPGTSGR